MRLNISEKLGLKISGHKDIDFVDVNIHHDTKLFLDPCLVECCDDVFSQDCSRAISDYFEKLYFVFAEDIQWEALKHFAHLGERNEAKMGYGNGRNGKAKTAEGMRDTLSDLSRFIQSGLPLERAIDIPLLMPRFAEDCMSDMIMNILYKHLSEYTIRQCGMYGIPTARSTKGHHYWNCEEHCWDIYDGESLIVDGEVVLLIPKRFVCQRLHCSTQHFFMSKIAPLIQKRDTVVFDGKEIRPNKQEVKASECRKYGSLLDATREYTVEIPHLLAEYHQDIVKRYEGRCLSDEWLDKYIYSTVA